ncbi:lytic transglycosylase [Desulfovibrio oxyclinae]|uniref:lytic transglycosylase n=1 Tax=Desulfovibrio oxyclinae TaxID=63560 RepID=UPI0003802897|nr:LysM peptidoglycan-binding domain-containing protein [Desulfovibrio oxyclinae]
MLDYKWFRGLLIATLALGLLAGCAEKKAPSPKDEELPKVFTEADEAVQPLEEAVNAEPEEKEEESLTETEKTVLESRFGLMFDLDYRETKEVSQYFAYFTHKKRRVMERWLKRAEPYLPYIRQELTKRGMPQDLAILPFAESGYNPYAYSWAGAGGMWQFIKGTGRKYGLRIDWWIDERRDPYKATQAALEYLEDLHERFGDWYLALAGYNAGEGKISRALRKTNCNDFFELTKNNRKLQYRYQLRKETRHYVPKFIALSKIFQNLDTLGFDPVRWDQEPDLTPVEVPGGTDLLALARAGGLSWKEFHKLNPAYRRQVSPPHWTTTAYLPAKEAPKMVAYLENPKSQPYAGYLTYRVRRGDSWWKISRRFGVPISVLKKINNRRSNILRPRQTVMVPGKGSRRSVASASSSKRRRIANSKGDYIIRRGDTLWSISRTFGVSVNTLKRSNGITNSRRIKPGMRLYIPNAGAKATKQAKKGAGEVRAKLVQYKVRRGDNLISIARRFGCTVAQLRKWNKLNRNTIYVNQRLKVYVN